MGRGASSLLNVGEGARRLRRACSRRWRGTSASTAARHRGLRARGSRVRHRGGHPVAARRARSHRRGGRNRTARRAGRRQRGRLRRPRLHRARQPVVGPLRARRHVTGLTRGCRGGPHRPGRGRGHGVPGARRRRRHDGRRDRLAALRVDGGAAVLDLLLQIQADQCRVPVSPATRRDHRPRGRHRWPEWPRVCGRRSTSWRRSGRSTSSSRPGPTALAADRAYGGWRRAVERSLGWAVTEPA